MKLVRITSPGARRAEFRDAHLEKAWAASARGELVLGGALANPLDGAVLLFVRDSPEVAEKFAKADPLCDERHSEALACTGMEDSRGGRRRDARWIGCSGSQQEDVE
jgi:hypothetical protein